MSRRLLALIICSLVLLVLMLSASAVLAEGASVSTRVTVARTIHVQNGSADGSNVPVKAQVVGEFITFVSP